MAPAGDESSSRSILKDLAFNQYQGILLGGVVAMSALTLSPLPFIVWLGGECVMLPLLDSVPALRRVFHRRRNAARRRLVDARRTELIESLAGPAAKRFEAMETLCGLIETNYQGLHGISQVYLTEQREKLDVILDGCLQRLVALQRYQRLMTQRTPAQVETEIAGVERQLEEADLPERGRAALQKNLELKQRLLQSIVEARDTMKALALELDSMVALLEVLHQSSVSMRDPQAFSQELDAIVAQSEASARAIREMEALLGESPGTWAADPAPGTDAKDARRMRNR
jgi:hypothetical protein